MGLPQRSGKNLCLGVAVYFSLLDDIRSYMRKRGVWTDKARTLTSEIWAKSLELAKLIPLD